MLPWLMVDEPGRRSEERAFKQGATEAKESKTVWRAQAGLAIVMDERGETELLGGR